MRWGQIRGKYFSINSFTASISCNETERSRFIFCIERLAGDAVSDLAWAPSISNILSFKHSRFTNYIFLIRKWIKQEDNQQIKFRKVPGVWTSAYLGTVAVTEPWVSFESDQLRVDYALEFFCRHDAKLHGDHSVHLAMTLQDRQILAAAWCLQEKQQTSNIYLCVHILEVYQRLQCEDLL